MEKEGKGDEVEAEIETERSVKLLLEKHLVEVADLRKACKVTGPQRKHGQKKKNLWRSSLGVYG